MRLFTLLDFKKRIKRVDETLNWINAGGCAVAALYMHEFLAKKDVDSEIVYMFRGTYDTDYLNNCENGIPDSCAHAVLKVDKNYYDTRGKYSVADLLDRGYEHIKPVPVEYVVASLDVRNRWNPMYDREEGTPVLQDIFESTLKVV